MDHTSSITALLEHQQFVQRLARSLVRDPSAADDLVQDTWVSYLQKPPQVAAALRGWLERVVRNRAHNRHREEARRARREAAAVVATTSEDPQDRLELQHRVVTAVLALAEPHRKAMLMHYYDGLSMVVIAQRLGVPAGTVRSRISRAIQELRERLDQHDDRGRAGWLPGLVALAGSPTRSIAKWSWRIAAGVTVATVAGAVVVSTTHEASPAPVASVVAAAAASPPPVDAASANGPTAGVAKFARMEVAAAPQEPQLASMSIAELQEVAAWVQHLLRQRLLVPEPNDIGVELAALKGMREVGATRILRREWAEFASSEALGFPGGGGYCSFTSGSHSWHDRPELGFEQGSYSAVHPGYVLDVGDVPLASLRADSADIAESDRDRYSLLWRPAMSPQGAIEPAWQAAAEQCKLASYCRAVAEHTYLLRCFGQDAGDSLYAFRTVATDARGHTLVHRLLQRFRAVDAAPTSMPTAPKGSPPKWVADLGAERLITLLTAIRAEAEPRLLAVPAELRTAHQALLTDPSYGICRVLQRGRFAAVVQSRGSGAYYGFLSRSNSYDAAPHLELQADHLSSGFAGRDRGFLVDLGVQPLAMAEGEPADASDALRAQAQFVRNLRPVRTSERGFEVAAENLQRAEELGVGRPVRAVVGHTFLLRAVKEGHSVLVALQVLALDDDGATLLWRMLAREGR